ncbi:MAG TPA: VCBS repeat-containing protein [Nitrososphaeria archaeon]|nr:VCBS repeat-containing protein [Nitrososphaeria archaeon]
MRSIARFSKIFLLFFIILFSGAIYFSLRNGGLGIERLSVMWKNTFWTEEGIFAHAAFDWPLVMDVDGDGCREVVKFGSQWIVGYEENGEIFMKISLGAGIGHNTYLFGDYNGDGRDEIAFGLNGSIYLVDPLRGGIDKIINVTGDWRDIMCWTLVAGNFDGDDDLELATAYIHKGVYIVDPLEGWVRLIGKQYRGYNLAGSNFCPVDVDDDGIDELFFVISINSSVGLMDSQGDVKWIWRIPLVNPLASKDTPSPVRAVVGDFDGDGSLEAVFTTDNAEIYAVTIVATVL